MQIGKECKKFTKSLNLRAVCVYGGTGISEQIAELKRGAEIIVCTPGRMIDLLAANSGRSCFHFKNILVLLFEICQGAEFYVEVKSFVLLCGSFHFCSFLILISISLCKMAFSLYHMRLVTGCYGISIKKCCLWKYLY
jgi:hypothetical protein